METRVVIIGFMLTIGTMDAVAHDNDGWGPGWRGGWYGRGWYYGWPGPGYYGYNPWFGANASLDAPAYTTYQRGGGLMTVYPTVQVPDAVQQQATAVPSTVIVRPPPIYPTPKPLDAIPMLPRPIVRDPIKVSLPPVNTPARQAPPATGRTTP